MRKQLDELLALEPFRVFRIVLTNGPDYTIANPQMLELMDDVALFAAPRSDLFSYLRLVQIVSLDIID